MKEHGFFTKVLLFCVCRQSQILNVSLKHESKIMEAY